MADSPNRIAATVNVIDRFRLGNGREIAVLGLSTPYLDAMKLDKAGHALHVVIGGKATPATLAFVSPLDAPACVSIDASVAVGLSDGDRIELVAVAK